jgi:Protein of unknown function (DUF2905)
MIDWGGLGRLLIGIGVAIAVLGGLLLLAGRNPAVSSLFSWFGKLPGDIFIKRDNFSLFVPLGTSILLSVLLSLVFYLLSWIVRR